MGQTEWRTVSMQPMILNLIKRLCSCILKHPHSKGFIQTRYTSLWAWNEKAQILKPRRVSFSRENKASVKCFHDRGGGPILRVIGDTRIDQEIYLWVWKRCTARPIHLENIFKRLSLSSQSLNSFFFSSISTLFLSLLPLSYYCNLVKQVPNWASFTMAF